MIKECNDCNGIPCIVTKCVRVMGNHLLSEVAHATTRRFVVVICHTSAARDGSNRHKNAVPDAACAAAATAHSEHRVDAVAAAARGAGEATCLDAI